MRCLTLLQLYLLCPFRELSRAVSYGVIQLVSPLFLIVFSKKSKREEKSMFIPFSLISLPLSVDTDGLRSVGKWSTQLSSDKHSLLWLALLSCPLASPRDITSHRSSHCMALQDIPLNELCAVLHIAPCGTYGVSKKCPLHCRSFLFDPRYYSKRLWSINEIDPYCPAIARMNDMKMSDNVECSVTVYNR